LWTVRAIGLYQGHCSQQLIVFSFLLHAASSAVYSALLEENVLSLPSTTTLNKVTCRLNSSSTTDNLAYLKLRVSKLNEFEHSVLLIIDEVYVAKRGEVQGMTGHGNIA